MPPALEITDLRKEYGNVAAVDGLSLTVQEGEIHAVLGPNGAGKTTAIECAQGLRTPTSGHITIFGEDAVRHRNRVKPLIGSQLQESGLPNRMKVWEALKLFDRGSSWKSLMTQWGLDDKRNASFSSLSGGQQQRLFLALALVNNPRLVFFDELTQGLDPTARRETWDLIREVRAQGTTVVMVTHFMEEAEALADRISIVTHGRIAAEGTLDELTRDAPNRVSFGTSTGVSEHAMRGVAGVTDVTTERDQIIVTGDRRIVQSVPSILWQNDIQPDDLRVTHPTLESVYFDLIENGDDPHENAA